MLLLEKLIPDLPVQDFLHRLQVQDVIRSRCRLVEHVANGSLNTNNGISWGKNNSYGGKGLTDSSRIEVSMSGFR